MQWFYDLPWPVALVLAECIFIGLAIVGHFLVRRIVKPTELIRHNDVAGFTIAVVGALYAVLLGFVVVVTWQEFDVSRTHLEEEAAAVSDAHDMLRLYGSEASKPLATLEEFARVTVSQEWPAMSHGQRSEHAGDLLREVENETNDLRPKDDRQRDILGRAFTNLATIGDKRRARISDNEASLPGPMWICLLLGAAITTSFGYLFGVERFLPQLLMTAAVAGGIGLQLFLTLELDYPFRGTIAVSPAPYLEVIQQFKSERDADRHF